VEIQTAIHTLHPRGAFRIARQRSTPFANVLLRLEHEGIIGWGEASPNPYYQETAEAVSASLHDLAVWLRGLRIETVADLEAASAEAGERLAPSRAAQCALDLALWDWLARRQGLTVAELALDAPPRPVTSFATIGLSSPEELTGKIEALRGFPRVKIKSDAAADLTPVHRVRAELGSEIAIDANCAWPADALPDLIASAAQAGVRFIEQPFLPIGDAQLTRGQFPLPVFADESCVSEDQVTRLADHFDGINVKLVKCGGLTPALRMLRQARQLGLQTMVGCMLETSVLIAAGCVAAQLADYADLDGAWLIADDSCTGWHWQAGILHPPAELGLGAKPANEAGFSGQ